MKTLLLIPALLFTYLYIGRAQSTVYEKSDSIKVVRLLSEAPALSETTGYMMYFGKKLKGTPYVAKTLETNQGENLMVNLHSLDCTTFTENVLALSLCARHGEKTFSHFAECLRLIRYAGGEISYENRLHYFTSWIDNNAVNGYVREDGGGAAPDGIYSGTLQLDINFMTEHTDLYPQLTDNPQATSRIRETEKILTGRTVKFIPKSKLKSHAKLKRHIQSGDIIAIVTKKQGLDVSHIGIASWHTDGTLHLLNASQIHKKVIDEPMTLYQYMQKHPSQIGIRVIHVL